MFPNLASDSKIFAVTATDAQTSSYADYCPPNDVVNGRSIGSCLGDLFSVSWMEDSDRGDRSETLAEQIRRVTKSVDMSHVMTFGDDSFTGESIHNFNLAMPTAMEITNSYHGPFVSVRDVPLALAQARLAGAKSPSEKMAASQDLEHVMSNRDADVKLFKEIVLRV